MDPFTLKGISCCPGVVEGSVLVVNSVDEAKVGFTTNSKLDSQDY